MSIEKKLYELKLDILQSEMYPSLRKKLADQIHEIELLVNTDKTELNLHSVSGCYWEKPKEIKLKLEDMASSEMKGNIKGLK